MKPASKLKRPVRAFTVRWCPVCGRDDRTAPLPVEHWSVVKTSSGSYQYGRYPKLCSGVPILLEYRITLESERKAVSEARDQSPEK